MKATNIEYDTVGEYANLPKEVELPNGVTDLDEISDYITEITGFCHCGFTLEE